MSAKDTARFYSDVRFIVEQVLEEQSHAQQPKAAYRLISLAEIRDAARQVNQDQSTWRDGPGAVAAMVRILSENAKRIHPHSLKAHE